MPLFALSCVCLPTCLFCVVLFCVVLFARLCACLSCGVWFLLCVFCGVSLFDLVCVRLLVCSVLMRYMLCCFICVFVCSFVLWCG